MEARTLLLGVWSRPVRDLVVHSLASFFFAPVLYILLARAEVLVDLRHVATAHHYVGVFVVTLALGLAVGAVWEIAEYTSDHFSVRSSREASETPRPT
jgi:hypothetical protein